MTSVMDGQVSLFDLDSWSGRTYPARSAATEERTSALFWRRLSESPNQNFLFLDCRKNKNGQKPEQSSVMAGLLRGELTTLNFGECPNAVVESRLSQILEDNVPQKYYLSAKACQGILNRSNRRGKKLPEILEMALKSMIEWQNTTTPCKSEADALGGGKGALIQTDKSATLGCGNTQTLFQRTGFGGFKEGVGTLRASQGQHGVSSQDVIVETVVIDGNGQRESHFGDGYKQTNKMYTLNTTEVHGVAYGIGRDAFNQGQNAQYKPSICEELQPTIVEKGAGAVAHTLDCRNGKVNEEISGTLQAKENGGFSYNCVNPVAYIQEKTGCLSPGAHAGSYNGQDAYNDMLITEPKCYGISAYESNAMKSGNPNSGIYEADTSRTLDLNGGNPGCNQGGVAVCEKHVFENHSQDARYVQLGDAGETVSQKYGTSGNNQPLFAERFIRWIVRRLTPLECERLQGFPDGWTDIGDWTDSKGKKHTAADTPRYKALGNSIALPFWYWMFKQMEKYLPEDATLGSLFDGIGGFPLCWEEIHGKGTARWASEIEEFPIAVTKYRFGED